MEVWAVVLLATILLLLLCIAIFFILRFYFPSFFAAFFTIGEEKQALTRNQQANTTYTTSVGAAVLDVECQNENVQEQMDEKASPSFALKTHSFANAQQRANSTGALIQRNDCVGGGSCEIDRSSPCSTDLGSEYDVGYNLTRAASIDSVTSDTSVMDLQPDLSAIGQLEVGLEYDRDVSELVVSVIQARELAAAATADATDAEELDFYVNIYLYPDAADMKTQTKIIRQTRNPIFKERFLYTVEPYEFISKTVQFQVYSVDKFARHKHVGEADVRLNDIDLQRPIRLWFNLREINEKPSSFGELMFSLSYLPTAERLTVVIVKAKNLKWANRDQLCGDIFVKVHMILNEKLSTKKKTSVKRGENQPTFNEAMIFSVPQSTLASVQLRLTVAEVDSRQVVTSIGHVIVGSNTGGTELSHWQQMMASLRKPVAMWHYLRKQK